LSSVVLKTNGKNETYKEEKVYQSVHKTLIAAKISKEDAKPVAKSIAESITAWISDKPHVTSRDIRHEVSALLKPHSHIAYVLYEKHRILS
jgi:transcriptional regulator NrdR family protein